MSHWVLSVLVLAVLQTQADATTSTAAQNAVQAPAPAAVFPYNDAEVPLTAPAPAYSVAESPVQNPKSDNAAETGQAQPKEAILGVSREQAAALKPRFHITGSTGWINDPNGMFQNKDGIYHVFYQWNPVAPVWGAPYWGHIVSTDLVHWERLPPALIPDTEYDYDGVFSGSATILDDGLPYLFFTGVSGLQQLKYYNQMQALARPANASDPKLKLWIKSAAPVIAQPPTNALPSQFRDPTTAWRQDGLWHTVIGTMESCLGTAALYTSPDFRAWTFAGDWTNQVMLGQATNGQCASPVVAQPGNGVCDQFGASCRMWECPDAFDVGNGTWAFKWSDQSKNRVPFSRDWYVLGAESTFLRSNASISTGGVERPPPPSFQSSQRSPRGVDFGSVYASKTFQLRDGRRVLLGWVYETAAGCEAECSTGTNFTYSLGWQGAHTLPREVQVDAESAALRMNPVEEVALLRQKVLYSNSTLQLPSNSSSGGVQELVLSQSAYLGRQMEVIAAFSIGANASTGNSTAQSPFAVGLQLDTGNGTYTRISINGTAAALQTGDLQIMQAGVYVDRSNSGPYSNSTMQGGVMPLPPSGLQASSVTLRVFVDHSIVEVYALEGRGRVTSRIYPLGLTNQWGLATYGTLGSLPASANITVWDMGNAFNITRT